MKSILVLAAHPDDEVLGCGGTIARMAADGACVHVAFFTDGVSSRRDTPQARKAREERRAAAEEACATLGVKSTSFADFPDNAMDSVALLEIVKVAEALIAEHRPDTLFTHHAGDVNIDHRRIHDAVIAACRPQRGHPVRDLLFFEVPSSTEWQVPGSGPAFVPNWYVDITGQMARKLQALEAYASELRSWPHPRTREGVTHLASWRGAVVGVEAAEAFVLGRHIA